MKTHLVVTQPFADHAKGDQITETEAMEQALEHHHGHVVRVATPEAEKPAPKTKAA